VVQEAVRLSGNEDVDRLAQSLAKGQQVEIFHDQRSVAGSGRVSVTA
jgi:hypothetical protein